MHTDIRRVSTGLWPRSPFPTSSFMSYRNKWAIKNAPPYTRTHAQKLPPPPRTPTKDSVNPL